MGVFISFDTCDSNLAYQLKDYLRDKGITSYLFDQNKQYDSTLHNKIANAINGSQTLVAIITKETCSPSVHEEIGYALGKEKSLIVMLEEDAEDGVLSHEREKEQFTKECFEQSCKVVAGFLKQKSAGTRLTAQDSKEFLVKRNIVDPTSTFFTENTNSAVLKGFVDSNNLRESINPPSIKSRVLFSACPSNLLDGVDVFSQDFELWLAKFRQIKVHGINVPFYCGTKKIKQGNVTYKHDNGQGDNVQYLEFNTNGFVEQGLTQPLLYLRSTTMYPPEIVGFGDHTLTPSSLYQRSISNHPGKIRRFQEQKFNRQSFSGTGNKIPKTILLNLCWLTGTYYGFLSFIGQYCKHIGYSGSLDVSLSIKHTHELMLVGFEDNTKNGMWEEPFTQDRDGHEPVTDQPNFLDRRQIETNSFDDKKIGEIAKKTADSVANTYGLEHAFCYDFDGTINQKLLGKITSKNNSISF